MELRSFELHFRQIDHLGSKDQVKPEPSPAPYLGTMSDILLVKGYRLPSHEKADLIMPRPILFNTVILDFNISVGQGTSA